MKIFRISRPFKNTEQIILRDFLALERTRMANERTFLSYIRTALYLLIGGIALLQLEGFDKIKWLGYFALAFSLTSLIIGIVQFLKLKHILHNYYQQIDESTKKPGHQKKTGD